MKPGEYERIFRAEDHHWWYVGMAAIAREVLRRNTEPRSNRRILDAGCGTGGAMATFLSELGQVAGLDVAPAALKFCRARQLRDLALASVEGVPFRSGCFDMVVSFDVIYERQVCRDLAAVSEFWRVLRPGGVLLLRVPAFEWLRGAHDITVESVRRYTRLGLQSMVEKGGFEVVLTTYANAWLFPLVIVKRLVLERLWPPPPDASDLSYSAGPLNALFGRILSGEARPASRGCIPFGSSVLALARKPEF